MSNLTNDKDTKQGRPMAVKYEQIDLKALITRFVALYLHRPRQRSEKWKKARPTSIGGSEVAGLMGRSPYSSFATIIARKVGIDSFSGSVACWWGSMFESAIERFVAIDCGTELVGTDISVPAPFKGHANSPDGYCVLDLFINADDEWQILTTDAKTKKAAVNQPSRKAIALLEFKCPYRRRPKGCVPRHYLPQIWSGLALSAPAHFGLFVDAVFRKCALWNLGPTYGYDRWYHLERTNVKWTTPVAWGFTAVYAPRLDAPRGIALSREEAEASDFDFGESDSSPAYEAWQLHYKYFGIPYESPAEAKKANHEFRPDLIDFGECEKDVFETMMSLLDAGDFPYKHIGPCFSDGRGAPLNTSKQIGEAIDDAASSPMKHHFLLGVIPWKMLQVDYVSVERRPGFVDEIRPLVDKALATAKTIKASENPTKAYYEFLDSQPVKKKKRKSTCASTARAQVNYTQTDLQGLFDAI